MEQFTQIKDQVSLRQVSMEIATKTLQYIYNYNSNISYDINKHLGIAKAIEKYIKGNSILPEYTDLCEELINHFKSNLDIKSKSSTPNLEVIE